MRWLLILTAVLIGPVWARGGERTWEQARAQARRDGKPLVTWVRQDGESVPGCVNVSVDSFPGTQLPHVFVVPVSGRPFILPGRLSAGEVARHLGLAVRTPVYVPNVCGH